MTDNLEIIEEKQLDEQAVDKSVVQNPPVSERQRPSVNPYVIHIATAASSISPWGANPSKRDKQLRSFWHTESWLASVVYSVSIRNASFTWTVTGSDPEKPRPKNTIRRVERILKNSNRGRGWIDLIVKTCIDLLTQDNGAFWEIIRASDSPTAPVINIAHLDSARCVRTGDPRYPIIYTNRKGQERVLRYWQVRTIEEMPAPQEEAYNLQYSAVSRALLAAEIIQSISVYKLEKVSGTFTRAIDAVSGLTQNNIDDALAMAEEQNLNKGLQRYSLPVILPGVDPTTSLSHIHIDLASLPDNFDEDISFKWYVAQLAAAFGVDYQEIAPLMTGNLGASQQSEILHLKTRGKGPALVMGLFENIINDLVPANVEFRFLEQDLRSETEKADARYTRSMDRAMRVKSGELTMDAARKIAVEDGDLPLWLANEIEQAPPEQLNVAQPTDQFSATQVQSGNETPMTTRKQYQRLAHKITTHKHLMDMLDD